MLNFCIVIIGVCHTTYAMLLVWALVSGIGYLALADTAWWFALQATSGEVALLCKAAEDTDQVIR